MSSFTERARKELQIAGLFDEDSDYGGMTAEAVMELLEVFSDQGHSGFSAVLVSNVFQKLVNGETLGPLTNDPDEWELRFNGVWQNTRNSKAFSKDAGETYYFADDIHRTRKV